MAVLETGIYSITNVAQKAPVARNVYEDKSLLPKKVVSLAPGVQAQQVSLPVIFIMSVLTLFTWIVDCRKTPQWELQAQERRRPDWCS